MHHVFQIAAIAFSLSTPAKAWNDMGHMVVAELAYQRLTPAQRETIAGILQQHPHYKEFLAAERPDGVPEGQWAFSHCDVA